MSQQALDLRRSVQIVRRHKILVGIMVALGLLAGGAYASLNPPMLTSTALVVPPASAQAAATDRQGRNRSLHDTTQVVIADSDPVLSAALPHVRPAMSLKKLRGEFRSEAPPPISFR